MMSKANVYIREQAPGLRRRENSQIIKSQTNSKDLEKIIGEQLQELAMRSQEIDTLQRNLESLSEFCKSEKQRTHYLSLQVESLAKENEQLVRKLETQAKAKLDPPKNAVELESLKESNNSLSRKLQLKITEAERLGEALHSVKIERERTVKELNSLKEKLNTHSHKHKELQAASAKEAEFKAQLQARNEDLAKQSQKLKKCFIDLTNNLKIKQPFTSALRQMAKEVKDFILDIQLKSQHSLTTGLAEISKHKREYELLEVKLHKALDECDAMKNRICELQEQCAANETLKKQIAQLETDKESINNQKKELSVALKQTKEELEQRAASLNEMVAQAVKNLSEEQVKTKEQSQIIAELQTKVKELGLKCENEKLQATNTMASLNAQLSDSLEANKKFTNQVIQMKNYTKKKGEQLSKLKNDIEKVLNKVSNGCNQVNTFKSELEKLKVEFIKTTGKNVSLLQSQNIQMVALKKEMSLATQRAESNARDNEKRLKETEDKLSGTVTKLKDSEKNLEELTSKLKALDHDHTALKNQIETARSSAANTAEANKVLKAELERKTKDMIGLRGNINDLESRLNKELCDKDAFTKKHIEEISALKENLNETISIKDKQMAEAKRLLETEIEIYKADVAKLKASNEEIQLALNVKEEEQKTSCTELAKLKTQSIKDKEELRMAAFKEEKTQEMIKRVDEIHESFCCNLTCSVCGDIMQSSTLCMPCGHCFCKKCLGGEKCPRCLEPVKETFESKTIEEIACKFSYSKKMVDVFKDKKYWIFTS